jgi:hypothetical protein
VAGATENVAEAAARRRQEQGDFCARCLRRRSGHDPEAAGRSAFAAMRLRRNSLRLARRARSSRSSVVRVSEGCRSARLRPPAPARQPSRGLCRAEDHASGEATRERRLVSRIFASWNQINGWLGRSRGCSVWRETRGEWILRFVTASARRAVGSSTYLKGRSDVRSSTSSIGRDARRWQRSRCSR